MGEEKSSYTVLQAAEVLEMSPKVILDLINEGQLETHRDQERGHLLIDARSVQSLLKALLQEESQSAPAATEDTMKTNDGADASTREKGPFFDADLLILLLIAVVTLLAASYTLLPQIFGG